MTATITELHTFSYRQLYQVVKLHQAVENGQPHLHRHCHR